MLITHDMGVVAEIADSVMVMYAGEMVEYGDVKTIFNRPVHPYTKGLLASLTRADRDVDRLSSIEGTVPPLSRMPAGCRFNNRCTVCSRHNGRCEHERPALVEVEPNHLVRCFCCAE